MDVHVDFGADQTLKLEAVLCIYGAEGGHRSPGHALVTVHEPMASADGAPTLGPGTLVSQAFVQGLVKRLTGASPRAVLPATVLACTADLVVWYSPPQRWLMRFDEAARTALPGIPASLAIWHPALVWRAEGSRLDLRAIPNCTRPEASTPLCFAPYMNVGANGWVCQGSMQGPGRATLEAMPLWEQAFRESAFTGVLPGARIHNHARGLLGLYEDYAAAAFGGTAGWDAHDLTQTGETLEQFVLTLPVGQGGI